MKAVSNYKLVHARIILILLSLFIIVIVSGCASSVSSTDEIKSSESEHVISLRFLTLNIPLASDHQSELDELGNMSVLASLGAEVLLLVDSEGWDLFAFMIETNQTEALNLASDNSIVLEAIAYGDWIVWLEQDRGSSGTFSADYGWRIMRYKRSEQQIRKVAEFTGMPGDVELIGLGDAVLPHSLTLTDEGTVAAVFNMVPAYLDRYSFSILLPDKGNITQVSELPAAVILFQESEDQETFAEQVLDRLDDQRARTLGSLQFNQDHLTWLWLPIKSSDNDSGTDPAFSSQSEANFLKVYDIKSDRIESLHLPGPAMSAAWIEDQLLVIPLTSGTPTLDDNWISGTVMQYDQDGSWTEAGWLKEVLASSIEGLPIVPQMPPYRMLTADHYITFTGLNHMIIIDMGKELCYRMAPDSDIVFHNPKAIDMNADAVIIDYQQMNEQEISTHKILLPLP